MLDMPVCIDYVNCEINININLSINKVIIMSPVKSLPVNTLRRLPGYLRLLRELRHAGRDVVSSEHIARELNLDAIQVRKDLQPTGIIGRPRIGYSVPDLIDAIETYLGWNNITDAFLVGAGSLGTALLGYDEFKKHGLNITAVFDSDPAKIGTNLYGREVMSIDQLPELAERMHIHIGILTVPARVAQDVTDIMLFGGIKAIWNFAPAAIVVPDNIIVENAQLSSSLAVLTTKLARMQAGN